MYRIVKEVYVRKKPLWLVDLLFQISPALYREQGSKDMVVAHFNQIVSLILSATVRWHHGKSLLSSIQSVTYDDKCICVNGKRGSRFLSFRIDFDNSPLKMKTI
ncbi:MAG: hypothetical protein SO013_06165 [Prevotella sp.]|nr:hypothetical protein [Prevotella sp.]